MNMSEVSTEHGGLVLWLGSSVDSFHQVVRAEQKGFELSSNPDMMKVMGAPMVKDDDDDDDEDESYEDMLDRMDFDHMVTIYGNVAVISVKGSLTTSRHWWDRYFGVVAYESIRNVLANLVNKATELGVTAVVLDIDSPGGSAKGVDEAYAFIKQVNADHLPVYAFTAGMMTSGAYWLSAATRSRYATRMSQAGSIGVMVVHKDFTKSYADAGVTLTVLREGEFKALGSPYEKLSDKAKQVIQDEMKFIKDEFVAAVSDGLGVSAALVEEKMGKGRVFFGAQAVEIGMIDKVATFDEVVNEIQARHNHSPSNTYQWQQPGKADMSKKMITDKAQAAMLAGASPEAAVAVHGAEAPVVATDAPAEAPETKQDDKAVVEAPVESAPEVKGTDKDQGTATGKVDSTLIDRLVAAQTELATVKASNERMAADINQMKADMSDLEAIVRSSVNNMQIGLGYHATNMEHVTGAALVQQHKQLSSEFKTRFKVGGVAVTQQDDSKETPATKLPLGAVRIK